MSPEFVLNFLLPIGIFALGAGVGSILNVVIYRIPHGISLKTPNRPFCPSCKTPLRRRINIPILSWLLLRGRCKTCQAKIGSGNFFVELTSGIIFVSFWLLFSSSVSLWAVIALWVLASLLLAATFIDFHHLIIPDLITLGGLTLGLVASSVAPELHGETTWYNGLFSGLVGVATGLILLTIILRVGKWLFGKVVHQFSEPVDFQIAQPGGQDDPIIIQLGPDHQYHWHDVFFRRGDKLKMEVTELEINGQPQEVQSQFTIVKNGLVIDGTKTKLHTIQSVRGKFTRAVVPREAIGFGNVKLVAMIGAFIGWQAVLVTVLAAFSLVILMFRFLKGRKVPISPFLALGALGYILYKFM